MSPASSSLPSLPLPAEITENYVDCTSTCGLTFHILEAGYTSSRSKPLILLCHGFPELAFSWRKIIPSLASAGYYVVAVDQRGYGRTTGWDQSAFDSVDLSQFTLTNLVRDLVTLVSALGYEKVYCIIGHDFGAVSASMSALIRPDDTPSKKSDIQAELAQLSPPRKHYKYYNSTAPAASDWESPPQGLRTFLRGYFHLKSADWAGNDPHPLQAWTASELAKMPEYYIMPLDANMPSAVAANMVSTSEDASETTAWLPDADGLDVYVQEWTRTGFQGGLNWYRTQTAQTPLLKRDTMLFAGKRIEVPSCFISGAKDWGNYQQPGALEGYVGRDGNAGSCSDFRGARILEGAGHWVQQEQPERVVEEVLEFLGGL
ncbi:hypothetical protein B0A49_13010 [Cryomyces minteri]|uniref:AB hydrolase-1 domain-containing protein n=1 Tax=Cryomyces minteri TaxID=331657 RepID=A0A4U0W1P4_9PEZI|nr:hypothetical protein B0A49_13010 [Cryomyces minteri]